VRARAGAVRREAVQHQGGGERHGGAHGPAGQHVGRPVDAQVDAADAHPQHQQRGHAQQQQLRRTAGLAGRQDAGEREVDDRRERRVAAGEAGGIDHVQVRHEVGPAAADQMLGHPRQQLAQQHGGHEHHRLEPPAVDQQQGCGHHHHQAEHREAAQRGDVARRLLQPVGPDRHAQVARPAQRQEDGAVEGVGVALAHLAQGVEEAV
jgi:hypothetical protein